MHFRPPLQIAFAVVIRHHHRHPTVRSRAFHAEAAGAPWEKAQQSNLHMPFNIPSLAL